MKSPQNKKTNSVQEKPQPKKKEFVDVIENYIKNKSLYFLFIPVVLLLLFVYRDFISMRHFFIFRDIGSDTITFNYPQYVCLSDYIRHFGIPSWSFQQGLGQNLYPFSIGDIFGDLLVLAGKDNIPKMLIWVELLKIVLIAFVSYLFFKKTGLSRFVSIIGACILAFSGFVILGGTWYIFSTSALYFMLLLYGFECLYQGGKWYIFPIAVLLVLSYQSVDLMIFCVFLLIYGIFRLASAESFSIKDTSILVGKMLGLGLIGFGLSAMFSFPTFNQIVNSPRVAGNVSLFHKLFAFGLNTESKAHYGTALMRLFSSDMVGTGSQYAGWGNYLEAPIFYCSLPILLLVPQVFSGTSKKIKILYGSTIAFILLTILFPFFRYAFWFFSGDYFRFYSFGIMLFFVLMALLALQKITKTGKVNLIVLGSSLVVILWAANSASSFTLEAIESIKKSVTFFIIMYALFLLMMNYERTRLAGQILLFVTLIFELGYMSSKTVNDRTSVQSSEFVDKIGYNDYSVEALNYIKSKDQSFYRVTKNYLSDVAIHMALNDAKVQNYRGSTNYYSFNQLQYITFFQETEAIKNDNETDTRWCIGYLNRPLLQLICNVKYVITKGQVDPLLRIMNDSLATFEDVTVRKSKFAMPLGVTYDSYITLHEFKKLQVVGKDLALMRSFIVDTKKHPINTEGLKQLTGKDLPQSYDFNMLNQDIINRKADSLHITSFTDSHIIGDIKVSNKKLLFLAIPNDEGWQATVDGKKQRPTTVSAGMMGIMLEKGNHKIELEYIRPFFKLGVIVSLCFAGIFLILIGLLAFRKKKLS